MALTPSVLFVNDEMLKEWTPINGSVDYKFLKPHIITAQDKYLEPYLGTALYEKLVTDHPTYSGAYLTLMDTYVRKVVTFWTIVEALPSLRVKINNGTLAVHSSEDWQAASEGEMKRIIDTHKGTALMYTQKMVDYLCYNASSFTEYTSYSGTQRPPKTNVYGSVEIDISAGVRDGQHKLNRFLP